MRPPPDKSQLADLNLKKTFVPFWLWLRDAATFHPWEVRMAMYLMSSDPS